MDSGTGHALAGVSGSAGVVFAVGNQSDAGQVYRLETGTWQVFEDIGLPLNGVWTGTAGDVWVAAGSAAGGGLLWFDGDSWEQIDARIFGDVWVSDGGDVFAVGGVIGDGLIVHGDGAAFVA